MAGSADGRRIRCAPRGRDGRPRLRGLGRRSTGGARCGRAGGPGRLRRTVARGRCIGGGDARAPRTRSGARATVATTGRRYFGFVNGATHPVALGSAWLASSWDQNAALPVMSPVAAKLHDVVRGWLVEAPAAPRRHRGRLRQRRDRGQRLLPRRGAGCAARPGRLGRPVRRPVRRSRAPGGHRRARPLDALEVARAGRPRPRSGHRRARRRPGPHARRPAARPRGAGAGVRAGGRGEHGRLRSRSTRSRTGWRPGRGGCTSTVPSGCGRSPTRAAPTSCEGSTGPTRGRPMATSGSTSPTTAGSPSSGGSTTCAARSPPRPGYLPPSDGFDAMHHTPQSSQRARQVEVWAVLRTLGRQGLEQLVVASVRRRRRHGRAARAKAASPSSTTSC